MSVKKKVIIIGDSGVGKTSLLYRYVFNKLDYESMPTLGASFKTQVVDLPEEQDQIFLNLWDTAGQEKFKSLTKMYFQDADAAIIMYDVTFRESFESARQWAKDLREATNVSDLLIAVAGNKCDLAD